MRKITINKNDSGKRLDKFIKNSFPRIPENLVQKYIRKKRIKINEKKVTDPSFKLSQNDVLELYINDEFFEPLSYAQEFKRAPSNIDIVYEDENIMLVNKKPGLIVHPDADFQIDCLINRIRNYLFKKGEYNPELENSFSPSLVNRIDRNTGGIVIAAKNAEALSILNEKIKNHEIHKKYLCIVCGKVNPKPGTLTGYLEKNSKENKVYINSKKPKISECKSIVTKYRAIETGKNFSLLEIDLLTGRTHQIRAHMAWAGHPLLGDGKYGQNSVNRQKKYSYQSLYSYKISFDFKENSGILDYLNGKSFEIPKEKIWFIKDFYENLMD